MLDLEANERKSGRLFLASRHTIVVIFPVFTTFRTIFLLAVVFLTRRRKTSGYCTRSQVGISTYSEHIFPVLPQVKTSLTEFDFVSCSVAHSRLMRTLCGCKMI